MTDASIPDLEIAANVQNTLGESPLWDSARGVLWWVDIKQAKLFCLHPKEQKVESWDLPRPATALAMLADQDALLLACPGVLMRFDMNTSDVTELAPFETDQPGNRPNDGKCDPAGRFWLGTMDDDEVQTSGALYCVGSDLKAQRVLENIAIPNTLVWSPDHTTFYFADSPDQTIWAFDYDNDSGALANRRVFASLKDTDFFPDGSTIDAEGYLWNAQWNGWRVVRYAPDGSLDRVIEMPVACPTSCMFGGENLETLYITSARKGQSDAALARQPQAGALFAHRPGVRGLPETPFGG